MSARCMQCVDYIFSKFDDDQGKTCHIKQNKFLAQGKVYLEGGRYGITYKAFVWNIGCKLTHRY